MSHTFEMPEQNPVFPEAVEFFRKEAKRKGGEDLEVELCKDIAAKLARGDAYSAIQYLETLEVEDPERREEIEALKRTLLN